MDWKSPFIVYRVSAEGKLQEVFHAEDLKRAKYWLTYIAEPGDVLCRTPVHPKHSKQKKSAEYCCHKEKSGTPSQSESNWVAWVNSHCTTLVFPEEQEVAPQ